MPTVEQLQVQYESNIAAQAKADQAALEGASAAMKKMGDTTDQVVRRAGPSMESLVTKTDGQAAAAARGESVNRRYAASVDTVNRSIASGVISAEQGAQAIQRLTVLRDQDLQKAAAHGQAIEQKFVPAVNSGTASTNRMSFAMRDLGLQSIDMFQGIATGQPVLRTLIQQGAQVAQVNAAMGVSFKETAVGVGRFITGLAANPLVLFGAATGAVVGGIVAIGAASESSARQMLTLQTRLRATRDDYVAMAAEVTAASKAIAATTGIGTSDARAAAQAIASVPNFAGTQAQLQDLIRTSADLAAVMGKTTPEAAATLAKALKDPGAVAKQLADDSFPGMTNAMARTIERMANAGDTVGAFNRTLGVIKGATEDARNQGLTPLEQALQRLDEVFTSSGQNGRTWIDHIGKAFTDAAAQAIDAVTSTIKAIQSLQSFVGALSKDKAPGETSPYGGNVSALPFGLTVDDVKKYFSGERTIQVPMSKRLGEIAQTLPGMTSKDFANAPDSFVSASGVNEVLSAQQAIAAARNATIGAAQGVIGGSPQGQIENLKDQIKRFTELRAVLDPASDDYKKLSTAIAVNQKAMADAGKQTAATVDGFTKQIAKLKEDTAAQTELAAAYPKGERAVAQVTAQLKAQEQVISGGVLPGMAKYSAQVAEATQRNLALAEATGRAQIAQAAAANDNHLELIQAESAALGMNVDERERLLARLKAEQELKSKLVPVESELGQQYLATVDAIVEQQQALERNKEALSAITSAFTSAFDQISQAITTSFLSGTGAAVNWRNVMMSVAQQVLAQFLKLAVLNPLLNSLFNQNNATLGNVVGALGSVGAAGGVGGTTSGGGGSLFDQGSNLFTLGGLGDKLGLTNFGETLGITGNGGLLSGVNSFLSGGLFGTSAAEGTNLALSGLGTGIYGPATASSVAANTTGLFGGASIGSLLGGAGAGFGLGSLAGGFLQSSLGKTGPGPTIGAAVGTAIGTAILPGIGSIIGGLLGGAGGGLIGPGPKTPYSIQQVSVDSSGYLSAGESQTQLIDETGAAKGEIGQFNAALQALGLTIDTFNTKFGNFTKNSEIGRAHV